MEVMSLVNGVAVPRVKYENKKTKLVKLIEGNSRDHKFYFNYVETESGYNYLDSSSMVLGVNKIKYFKVKKNKFFGRLVNGGEIRFYYQDEHTGKMGVRAVSTYFLRTEKLQNVYKFLRNELGIEMK